MAAMTLAACTNDDNGGAFMGGDEAMVFTASSPSTRATVDGNWDRTNGKQVAVCIGGVVKPYTISTGTEAGGLVGSAPTTATLSSADPFYWTKSEETVSAWYPYDEGVAAEGGGMTAPDVVVERNQSGNGYAASDWLIAKPQPVTYASGTFPALEFRHRTAKVTVNVTSAIFQNPAACKVAICVGDDSEGIKAHCNAGDYDDSAAFSALVAPVSGAPLTVIITYGEQKYRYIHSSTQDFEANKQYALNLKVVGDKVVFDGCSITQWNKQPTISENIPDSPNE